jgi:hypothetical protein
MKYVSFFDESYFEDAYFISALLVPEESVPGLNEGVGRLLDSYSSYLDPLPPELHAHELMSGAGPWKPIAQNTRLKIRLLRRILQLVASIPMAVIFTEGTDVARLNARYSYPEKPHAITLRYLLEVMDRWGVASGAEISLIADDHPTKGDHQLELRRYQEVGTGAYSPRVLTSLNGPIDFVDSRDSPGVQLADTIVYLFRRREYLIRTGANPKSIQTVADLLKIVRPQVKRFRLWAP